jgi:hypothetical protein
MKPFRIWWRYTRSSSEPPDKLEVSDTAARCGRVVFCVSGMIAFTVPLLFEYADPGNRPLLAAGLMGAGMILIWFGIALPPHIVAHAGFWLPAVLPDE